MKWTTTSMIIELTEEKILVITPPDDFEGPETIEHARENIQVLKEKVQGEIKGALAYMPAHYVNVEATRFYKTNVPNVPTALIADSFFRRMIGNFMLTLTSPERPVRLFPNEKEAHKWLRASIRKAESKK